MLPVHLICHCISTKMTATGRTFHFYFYYVVIIFRNLVAVISNDALSLNDVKFLKLV